MFLCRGAFFCAVFTVPHELLELFRYNRETGSVALEASPPTGIYRML